MHLSVVMSNLLVLYFFSTCMYSCLVSAQETLPTVIPKIDHSPIKLPKFSEKAHGLRSGPVFIINEKTFFITNLHYDGKGPDAHFWVGNGTKPDVNGMPIPDENGSNSSLKAYNGQNIYIVLPGNYTMKSINYLSMWCIKYKHNFGEVIIPKERIFPPVSSQPSPDIEAGRYVARIQMCCMPDQHIAHNKTCVAGGNESKPAFEIRRFGPSGSIQTFTDYTFKPFTNFASCGTTSNGKRQMLEPINEKFHLTSDGFLVYKNSKRNVSQDDYCVATYNRGNDTHPRWETLPLVCLPPLPRNLNSSAHTINSTFSLIAVFLLLNKLC